MTKITQVISLNTRTELVDLNSVIDQLIAEPETNDHLKQVVNALFNDNIRRIEKAYADDKVYITLSLHPSQKRVRLLNTRSILHIPARVKFEITQDGCLLFDERLAPHEKIHTIFVKTYRWRDLRVMSDCYQLICTHHVGLFVPFAERTPASRDIPFKDLLDNLNHP